MRLSALRSVAPLLLLLLAACATGPQVSSTESADADFDRYRSFAFYEPLAMERGGYATPASERARAVARRELEARGYRYDPESPDLWVNINAYLVERTNVSSMPTVDWAYYYSYRHGYVAVPFYSERTLVSEYREGTMNVDLVDVARKRLVWEGVATGRAPRKEADRLARIDETMARIFQQFPYRAP
ncbi:DUF4136 domain-containing protein [Arenimonas fontis]|uniref:DUF4136 domain-containing protein n=1 Tax=Arenimonas fontis TaxID=2608255 RepID=A0A5B2ZA24_9GAMM|nr:DUF4136 domain-containing protein [Arenimonas fontis]KAA2284373.1 DUF4136 domain-containing protein [Arenimonas fontis]